MHLTKLRSVALSVILIAHFGARDVGAAAERRVAFDAARDGQVAILIDGEPVAVYVFADENISRPYFAHLKPTAGLQASRNHPPQPGKDIADHGEYHPGLWMSFGDISGSDYWRLKAPTRHVGFTAAPEGGPGRGSLAVRNAYVSQNDPDEVVCHEDARYTVVARPHGYLLIWDSQFSSEREFYFGDQEEMGLGLRIATPLRVDKESDEGVVPGNGRIVDSVGRVNGDEVWGNTAQWCDYSGELGGQRVGMALFCHPKNFRASWFHARDYGLLEANPFGRKAFEKGAESRVVVKPGEKLRLRYGVLVHASESGDEVDLPSEYEYYLQSTVNK